jgi:hypothetical protein
VLGLNLGHVNSRSDACQDVLLPVRIGGLLGQDWNRRQHETLKDVERVSDERNAGPEWRSLCTGHKSWLRLREPDMT